MKIKPILCFLCLVVVFSFPFIVYADEEPSSEVSTTAACEHNFNLTGFDTETGLATIKCSLCDYTYTDYFVNHVSSDINANQNDENYDAVFDVVNDGVINNKDYAYLMQLYSNDFSIEGFTNKEKFILIYSTVILLVFTLFIVVSVRRKA